MYQLGFIGTGNMAGALVEAACKTVDPAAILLTNRTAAKAEVLAQRLGCQVTTSNSQVAQNAKWIFLGVKPQMMAGVLKEIAPVLAARKDRFILVSMAAGLRLETLAQMVGENYPILRIMPNTPAAIGEGMIFYTPNYQMTESRTSAPFWPPAVSWTGCRNPCWTPAQRWQAAAARSVTCSWKPWPTAVSPVACPDRRHCCTRPKWSSVRQS